VRQFELDFEGGLIDRFPEWEQCVRNSVSGCGRQLKAVAADLDMSSSELSRKLAHKEPGSEEPHFPFEKIPDLIAATNLEPIYWLIEKFCDGPEVKRRRAIQQLAEIVPRIQALIKESASS
jgi:hypothetical protein